MNVTKSHSNLDNIINFKKVKLSDKAIILSWFKEDHVKEFYHGDGLKNTLKNIDLFCKGKNNNGNYTFYHWIAFYQDTPFAFFMTSPVEGPYNETDDYKKWYVKDKKTYTLDLLIGEKKFLGRGLAQEALQ